MEPAPKKLRAFALTEVTAFLLVFLILAWYFQARFNGYYGWFSKTLMIGLGLVGIFIHKNIRGYGLVPKSLKFSLKWSLYVSLLFAIVSSVFITIAFAMKSIASIDLRTLAIDALWFFVFVGFAEELFFRGYVQSRLNEVFTRKYGGILGVKYQWSQGTLITGVFLFGLPHLLTGVNPFTGYMRISPALVGITGLACFLGVVFGILREKTGGVILPAVLHGFIDYSVFSIGKVVGLTLSNAVAFTSLLLFFVFMFHRILSEDLTRVSRRTST